jgi:hypothetical protein
MPISSSTSSYHLVSAARNDSLDIYFDPLVSPVPSLSFHGKPRTGAVELGSFVLGFSSFQDQITFVSVFLSIFSSIAS